MVRPIKEYVQRTPPPQGDLSYIIDASGSGVGGRFSQYHIKTQAIWVKCIQKTLGGERKSTIAQNNLRICSIPQYIISNISQFNALCYRKRNNFDSAPIFNLKPE